MAYLAFLYFGNLSLVLKSRAVTNPFPDLLNFSFDSEDVASILFGLSNFSEMSTVTIFSLPLISLSSSSSATLLNNQTTYLDWVFVREGKVLGEYSRVLRWWLRYAISRDLYLTCRHVLTFVWSVEVLFILGKKISSSQHAGISFPLKRCYTGIMSYGCNFLSYFLSGRRWVNGFRVGLMTPSSRWWLGTVICWWVRSRNIDIS